MTKREIENRNAKPPRAPSAMEPNAGLLAKLASIIVHVDEGQGQHGHHVDWGAAISLCHDDEVKAWIEGMRALCLVPLKRHAD